MRPFFDLVDDYLNDPYFPTPFLLALVFAAVDWVKERT